jgi:2-dehydro-3-deoxyphosphooctonate aldolase (KDO 8-P synthase)
MDLYSKLQSGTFLIAGPCVIEDMPLLETVAQELQRIQKVYGLPVIFKASYDKANRTSASAFRGPGMEAGLEMLAEIKAKYGLPILTDIHESYQAAKAASVADVLQIPAFLCRQTDLLMAAAETGKIVNIKKAQFLSGAEMKHPARKVSATGNHQILLTERGNMYGYNNLVVDFRNIADMKQLGYPVVMDCTHAVQRPGAGDGRTLGNREFVPCMALSAKVWGAGGYFMEVHPNPNAAPSDGPNMLFLDQLEALVKQLIA